MGAGNKTISFKIGRDLGFIFMFFLFTVVFYFIFHFLNKLPPQWNYLYILFTSLTIVLIGGLLKMSLR